MRMHVCTYVKCKNKTIIVVSRTQCVPSLLVPRRVSRDIVTLVTTSLQSMPSFRTSMYDHMYILVVIKDVCNIVEVVVVRGDSRQNRHSRFNIMLYCICGKISLLSFPFFF